MVIGLDVTGRGYRLACPDGPVVKPYATTYFFKNIFDYTTQKRIWVHVGLNCDILLWKTLLGRISGLQMMRMRVRVRVRVIIMKVNVPN